MRTIRSTTTTTTILLLSVLFAGREVSGQGYESPGCEPNDPMSCDRSKHEVCIFEQGIYKCQCPVGVSRLRDGRCVGIDECAQAGRNDCDRNGATCIDQADGYTCRCLPGYADVSVDKVKHPGRICQPAINECSQPTQYNVDCDVNAACTDTDASYTCVCRPGYVDISTTLSRLPGRKCLEAIDECADRKSNDCSENSDCIDARDGYICKCRQGYVDVSPNITHYPGRICNSPKNNEYDTGKPQIAHQLSQCDPRGKAPVCSSPNEQCVDVNGNGEFTCQCTGNGVNLADGSCRVFSRCQEKNDCDPNAICSNAFDTYKCQCKPGYLDVSPDAVRLPGRRCNLLVNECADKTTNDCSPFAKCEDAQDGYSCVCLRDYTDVSSRYNLKPGRRCSIASDQCSDRTANSCDDNADCVMLPDGYACKCLDGYVDVSTNAKLPPGRACTLDTTCPTQPTDLVFLLDGSGSIGSFVFHDEVLRFITEFVDLFDIGPDRTRVGVVQYSDRIRHEFDLSQYTTRDSVIKGIDDIEYLTGLTRTGAAIDHVVNEAFSERRGARPSSDTVSRVAIVITDGRSQDNVTEPARRARDHNIQLFAVGVTDHVLDSELEAITGSRERFFRVHAFTDLNTRLRSIIQKGTCPHRPIAPPTKGSCDPITHDGCDRSLNQVCVERNGKLSCACPDGFDKHPLTQVCGGGICNPQLITSCPDPEECRPTPFGNFRCTCPQSYFRDQLSGACVNVQSSVDECGAGGKQCNAQSEQCINRTCQCKTGYVRDRGGRCGIPGSCDPSRPDSCDQRKNEVCLRSQTADAYNGYTCQCNVNHRRHSVTGICLIDECASGTHTCSPLAICTDTDESYLCACKQGYIDKSPIPDKQPGRVCTQERNECNDGTHNCSTNANCIDLPDGFLCRCRPNYVDFSPNPLQFAGIKCEPLVDECAPNAVNNCHQDAYCIDTRESYKCQCKEGYVDVDGLQNPGRNCKKLNQRCANGSHDCDRNAKCIERGANDYECVCNPGYLDQSNNTTRNGQKQQTGRVCLESVCIDPSKNDCHQAAICTEVAGNEKYVCRCRDGFVDISTTENRPGRNCKEEINECLDRSLNDCDPLAVCQDESIGYTCKCPIGSIDRSVDAKTKPGRKCFALIDECSNPHLNNCSRFAVCTDKEDGYDCRCPTGYHDKDPTHPGIDCNFVIDECAADNQNDCSKHAKCVDTLEGYTCECIAPYVDDSQQQLKGRLCKYNECNDAQLNDCDPKAKCVDTDDDYYCQCADGFYDNGTNPLKPGRLCIAIEKGETRITTTTLSPDKFPCGGSIYCTISLDEVCIGGGECGCRPGYNRRRKTDKCQKVDAIPIELRIVGRDQNKLVYSSDYAQSNGTGYVQIVEIFTDELHKTIETTQTTAPRYVTTDVNYITHPKTSNSSWSDGLLFNATVSVTPGAPTIDKCLFWKELIASIEKSNYRLGGGQLVVADDVDLLDPCKPANTGISCGNGLFCNVELGEECIGGRICGCPDGQKRSAAATDKCRQVEFWVLPLWVIRKGSQPLNYNSSYSNPQDSTYRQLVTLFEKGIADSYAQTPLKNAFVVAEVNEIVDPASVNQSLQNGILYNFSSYFGRGSVSKPSDVFTSLVSYILDKNNNEIGKSDLYIDRFQMNPFLPCFNSNCHPKAICHNQQPSGYECVCASGYRDRNPVNAGHDCVPIIGYNECEHPEDNDCSEDARCIDEDHLYRCECRAPYVNAADAAQLAGSVCRLDYCSDVNYCPANTTCVNEVEQAVCVCKAGYIDIRKSDNRLLLGFDKETYCLNTIDVDECALGLTNCSAAAICTDLRHGYKCNCPAGYTDGIAEQPGRVCAALLCGLCHGNGDCVHDPITNNVTCQCVEGWSGEYCDVAPSNASLILLIILALLFLLLTLCCLLYLCLKCRCLRKRLISDTGSSAHEFMGSSADYYSIPRAKLRPDYVRRDDGAGQLQAYLDESRSDSGSSIVEEYERRIITDVNRSEIRTTTTSAADHTAQFTVHPPIGGGGGGGIESEANQFAANASHANYGGAAIEHRRAAAESSSQRSARSSHYDDDDSNSGSDDGDSLNSGVGGGALDRTTRITQSHDWQPNSDGRRGGLERSRNEISTITRMNETNILR